VSERANAHLAREDGGDSNVPPAWQGRVVGGNGGHWVKVGDDEVDECDATANWRKVREKQKN